MSRTLAIARRELWGFFTTPTGYVVLALFLFTSGFVFTFLSFGPGVPASMRSFFFFSVFLLMFVAPAISMRQLAEEQRLGTMEGLMTCPLSETEIVLGKWLGALGFFLVMLVPSLLYVVILEQYSTPDYGPIATGYLGLFLVGGLYLALGLVTSSLWDSQVLAYLLSLFFWLAFAGLTSMLPQHLPEPFAGALASMSIDRRFSQDFAKGVLDVGTIAYFASGIAFFLALAVKIVESRRWR